MRTIVNDEDDDLDDAEDHIVVVSIQKSKFELELHLERVSGGQEPLKKSVPLE